jgi:hypothetical protein
MEVRYTTVVDKDVFYDSKQFAQEVEAYLADPHGWISRGYTFMRSRNPKVVIHLSSPTFLGKNKCKDSEMSCAEMNGRNMYLNADRWLKGASKSKLQLKEYRQYMVSHEMGHILGYDHVSCPGNGNPAPIMLQQTRGIGTCKPNTKLTDIDTNR